MGMGFEYFYGFVGGDASQWEPNLFRNTTAIYPFRNNPGWNLETAMADEAIHYMKQLKELAPEKPWFVYYVPGGAHAPHRGGLRYRRGGLSRRGEDVKAEARWGGPDVRATKKGVRGGRRARREEMVGQLKGRPPRR